VFVSILEAQRCRGLLEVSVILLDDFQVVWFLAAGLVKAIEMLAEPDSMHVM